MKVIHQDNSYKLEHLGQVVVEEVVDTLSGDLTAFLGICHAIHYCLKKGLNVSVYSSSPRAVKWVKEESVPVSSERVDKAIKYLKSVPTKKTLNIEAC